MINKLINLANYLDESGLKKEADRVDLFVFASEDEMSSFEKYIKHTALNTGMAARVIIGPYDKSLKERLMELFNNFYYAAIPPWTHHTEEELESMSRHTVLEWFLCGYMASGEEYKEKCLEKEISPKDIHDAANAARIEWDNNKKFMDRTEELVKKRHLDDMTEKELRSVLVAIEDGTF